MSIVFFNGDFIEENRARISATSPAALFGEGVFTTMLIENGEVINFEDHVSRLKNDANFLGVHCPKIDLEDINKLISINGANKGRFRLRITLFSKEKAELNFCEAKNSSKGLKELKPCDLLINLYPLSTIQDKPTRLCIYPEVVSTCLSTVKSLNYLSRFIIKRYAMDRGFDDSLILGPKNKILETSFANIFWIEGRSLFIPDKNLPYFRGTTLDLVIKKLSFSGYKICEGFFELKELSDKASIFLCSSLQKIVSVSQIDNRAFDTTDLII